MYVMMFCIAVGVAWISILFLEICIINPYIKYIKYPRMKKRGYIIEDGYLPYKPTDTIKIKEGYHNPLDAFGFSSKNLLFNSLLNFMLEVSYEIAGALLLGWLLSKTGLLDYKRIICKQNTII